MSEPGGQRQEARGRMTAPAVSRAIRDDVINGVHRPGQRLTEEAMAARYGVSRVPVREALRTLEAEGFLQSRPYAGIAVVELDDGDAEDLLEVRALLEPLGAARAARRRTAEQLGRLKELVALGREAVERGRLAEVARLNSRFHEVIAEASGSRTLTHLVTQLSQKIAWVYAVELPRRAADSWDEHGEIVRAIEDGDAQQAAALVARHIAQARTAYRRRAVAPEGPARPAEESAAQPGRGSEQDM